MPVQNATSPSGGKTPIQLRRRMVAMALLEQIQKDLVAAMKAKDEARLGTVRMIKTALKKHEIDSMKPLDEATEMQVMSTLIKQRREAADLYRKGGREDLAEKEEAELKLIESYMPAEPTENEMDAAIEAAVGETGASDMKQMGAVMKAAQAKLAGKRVDGRTLSAKVKARLGS
ncbi:MAG TPA: GatB/YqeY domain-containing protein [Bryobacteraceae bacterium]|nr:GatB/YqeY domain-containing protein [Bryobacteraceae bacterium]